MKALNENQLFYLYRLLSKIKFSEINEYEIREFINSPFGTEILCEIVDSKVHKLIPSDLGLVDTKVTDLILSRVEKWEDSSKRTAQNWDSEEIESFLVQMIKPFDYNQEILSELTLKFKEKIVI